MLSLDQAIQVIHAGSLIRRDTLLLLLAIGVDVPKSPATLKGLGKNAGVKGIGNWNISAILRDSKGQAVPNGSGWLLSPLGHKSVLAMMQGVGIVGTPSAAVPPSAKKGSVASTMPPVLPGR